MDGINAAREYDAAARAMAEHCDARIEKMQRIIRKIKTCAEDGQNGSAAYALDRLNLIAKYAVIAMQK